MKPKIKYFLNFVIDLHLFTPVVRLANFLIHLDPLGARLIEYTLNSLSNLTRICMFSLWKKNIKYHPDYFRGLETEIDHFGREKIRWKNYRKYNFIDLFLCICIN